MIAMSNGAIKAVTAIFLILLSMSLVAPVLANPFFMFHTVDPVPGTTPPTIMITSPQNGAVYPSDRVAICFNVSRPLLSNCRTALIDITYKLDLGTFQAFTIWRGGSASNGWAIPEYSTNVTSIPLSAGNHTLTVVAEGVVYVEGLDIFFISGSSTVYFTTGTVPSQLNLTITRTSTPTLVPTAFASPSRSPPPIIFPLVTASPPVVTNKPVAASQSPQLSQSTAPEPSATIPEFPTASLTFVFLLTAAITGALVYSRKGRSRYENQ